MHYGYSGDYSVFTHRKLESDRGQLSGSNMVLVNHHEENNSGHHYVEFEPCPAEEYFGPKQKFGIVFNHQPFPVKDWELDVIVEATGEGLSRLSGDFKVEGDRERAIYAVISHLTSMLFEEPTLDDIVELIRSKIEANNGVVNGCGEKEGDDGMAQ